MHLICICLKWQSLLHQHQSILSHSYYTFCPTSDTVPSQMCVSVNNICNPKWSLSSYRFPYNATAYSSSTLNCLSFAAFTIFIRLSVSSATLHNSIHDFNVNCDYASNNLLVLLSLIHKNILDLSINSYSDTFSQTLHVFINLRNALIYSSIFSSDSFIKPKPLKSFIGFDHEILVKPFHDFTVFVSFWLVHVIIYLQPLRAQSIQK